MQKTFIGKTLKLKWEDDKVKNRILCIQNLVCPTKELSDFALYGNPDMLLYNVFEDENGNRIEDLAGTPIKNFGGFEIQEYIQDEAYWHTPNEQVNSIKEHEILKYL